MVVKFTFQYVFGNSGQNPRHFSARGREESPLWVNPLICFANIKTKDFTSWKSFCRSGSQTLFFGGREATTGNASAVRMLIDPRTIKIQVFNYATVETFRNHLNLSDLSGNSPQNYECCLMVCLQKNLRIFCFQNTLWMDNRRSVPVLTLKRVRTESVF